MASHFANMFGQIGQYTKNSIYSNGTKEVVENSNNKVNENSNIKVQVQSNDHSTPTSNKPLKLKNVSSKAECFDTLHTKATMDTQCSTNNCLGSVMNNRVVPVAQRPPADVLKQAKDFLDQYYSSIRRSGSQAQQARWEQVRLQVEATGGYELTETELTFGAKLAWRNAVRCIGRIQWSKLQVFDCRYVTTTSGMFEALCNHIKYSTNKGNIRSAITIFPQRNGAQRDFRIWNAQLISYAGYRGPGDTILGDPMNLEFTELCTRLGWRGHGTRWDVLPLVLSAGGHDPDYFDIPDELVLQVPLTHPNYPWFKELDLRWYALPAVSNMLFDCGGLQFTATAFNGWYMSTEIACRNMCDQGRFNMLEPLALRMGLDTSTPTTLWKDRALVEMNAAVLHSFQQSGVTIVDHHTASDSFMKHCENEQRLRSGCPADWVWIVPPMSGSVTPVFHQEMALYFLSPSYEYQEAAWKTHVWKKGREGKGTRPSRKFNFKQIARAVKFTSKLFGHALSRRIKATVLFATETGKSENYARKLADIFGHAFNAQVVRMDEYDITSIEHEGLLLVVSSTFGNGDPPENGEAFAQNLYAMKMADADDGLDKLSINMATSRSFIKAHSSTNMLRRGSVFIRPQDRPSAPGLISGIVSVDVFGTLSNVRFAVFALGSSAYPNFCAFGGYVDKLLGELGGERLVRMGCGDEMCGQEQAFKNWASEAFKVACETFCLEDTETFLEATQALNADTLSQDTIRFVQSVPEGLVPALKRCYSKKVVSCKLIRQTNLHKNAGEGSTMLLEIEIPKGSKDELKYEPGDHVGVFPENRSEIVNGLLERLEGAETPDASVELQILKETQTYNGVVRSWSGHERLPRCSLRMLLTRFLDLTTPPSPAILQYLSSCCSEEKDKNKLQLLSSDSAAYEDWRHSKFPHLLEVLEQFPSCKPSAKMLCAQLSPLQARFYSVSSAPGPHPGQIHLTVAVVQYRTQNGEGPMHYGVCSNYLKELPVGNEIAIFVRSAPSFHLPVDSKRPIVLIGPGTGVAPFRGFWHSLHYRKKTQNIAVPRLWLFFGCRQRALDLYREEKDLMLEEKIIDREFLALSRQPELKKTYVQDLVMSVADDLRKILIHEHGHLYVCGDVTMAECVHQAVRTALSQQGSLPKETVDRLLLDMRDENRYHEDIFGITLRTAEVHNRSRATARIRLEKQN